MSCQVDTTALEQCKKTADWYKAAYAVYLENQRVQDAAYLEYNTNYTKWKTAYDAQLDKRNAGRKAQSGQVWDNNQLFDCTTLSTGPVFSVDSPVTPMTKLGNYQSTIYVPRSAGKVYAGNPRKYTVLQNIPSMVAPPGGEFIAVSCTPTNDPLSIYNDAEKSCYSSFTEADLTKYFAGKYNALPSIAQFTRNQFQLLKVKGGIYTANDDQTVYFGPTKTFSVGGVPSLNDQVWMVPKDVKKGDVINVRPYMFGTDLPPSKPSGMIAGLYLKIA